jgi:hypothetical protein
VPGGLDLLDRKERVNFPGPRAIDVSEEYGDELPDRVGVQRADGGGVRREVLDEHREPPDCQVAGVEVCEGDLVVALEIGLYRIRVVAEEVGEAD